MVKDRAFKVFLALPYDVIDNLAEMVDAFQTDDEITKAVSRYVMLLYSRRQDNRAEIYKINLRYRSLETFSKTVQATAPQASRAWMGDQSRLA